MLHMQFGDCLDGAGLELRCALQLADLLKLDGAELHATQGPFCGPGLSSQTVAR